MNNIKKLAKKASFLLLTFVFLTNAAIGKENITVFAAASLTNALTEIGQQYDQNHNTKVLFSFASSSTLARQIAQGAPAEIFISANQKWMDYLVDNHAIDAKSRKTLLKNTLVLIASKETKIGDINLNKNWNIRQTLGDNRLAVGDPDHVPAGKYAEESLKNLRLWQQAEPLLARASNVRAALALVERDEAPLGIVYSTDAAIAKGVKIIATFPEQSHQPIEYPLAMVSESSNNAVKGFYQYLQSPAAKTVFIKYGFRVI